MSGLHISDELLKRFPYETVRDLHATRNTSEVSCVVCGQSYAPGSPGIVNVLLSKGIIGQDVFQFACQACAPSGYTHALVAKGPGDSMATTKLVGLRPQTLPKAMLLWEAQSPTMIDNESADAQLYGFLGLTRSVAGLLAFDGPLLNTFTVDVYKTQARIMLTDAGIPLVRAGLGEVASLGPSEEELRDFERLELWGIDGLGHWLGEVAQDNRCLLVTGAGLGLEQPSLERVNMVLDEGRAVAGIAPVRIVS